MMYRILENFQMPADLHMPILKYAQKGFKHSKDDIRNAAQRCIVELYKIMGPKLRQNLDADLRPAQLEVLEKGFNEVDGYDPNAPASKPSRKQEEIITNIEHKGQGGGGGFGGGGVTKAQAPAASKKGGNIGAVKKQKQQ